MSPLGTVAIYQRLVVAGGGFFLLLDLGPGAAAGGMGIDTLGTVAIYQRLVVVRAMKKLWEDLTFFMGTNELWEINLICGRVLI